MKVSWGSLACWAILVQCVGLQLAFAADGLDELVIPKGSTRIAELVFTSLEVTDDIKNPNEPGKRVAHLIGQYTRRDWALGWSSKTIKMDAKGRFRLKVPLLGAETKGTIYAIGPFGQTEKQDIVIHDPKLSPRTKIVRKTTYSPSIGYSAINYREGTTVNVSESAITGKFGVDYPAFKRASLGGSIYLTLLPFGTQTIRFLGVNARANFQVTPPDRTLALSTAVGYYYTSTMAEDFGFVGLNGPQVLPSLRWNIADRKALTTYLKLSLISYGAGFLGFGNNETAFGLSYSFPAGAGRTWSVSLDIATLKIVIPDGEVKSSSTSFGLGYNF